MGMTITTQNTFQALPDYPSLPVTTDLFDGEAAGQVRVKKARGPKKKSDADVNHEIAMASRLRERRQALKLSIGTVAAALHISGQRYRNWEERFGRLSQTRYLQGLAGVLGTSAVWLRTGQHASPEEGHLVQASAMALAALKSLRLTPSERSTLGKRAMKRRADLRLKSAEVALEAGIDSRKLGVWERCLPASQDAQVEALWEQALQAPPGWLRDASIVAPAPDHASTADFETVGDRSCAAGEIRAIGCWLARESVSKRTTRYDLLTASEQRGADMFALRFGVEGDEASTLQAVGERYGVTRERARQITLNIENRRGDFTAKTPCLDRLRSEIQRAIPVNVEQINADFRDLLGEALSIENADRFAREVLGRSIVTLTEKLPRAGLGYSVFAIDPDTHDPQVIRACRDVAQGLIRISGAAQLSFVAGQAGVVAGRAVSTLECERACRLMADFEWLAQDDGWFWFGPSWENRLLTVTRKVLAVAGRKVDIEDIQGAMVRSRRSHFETGKQRPYAIDAPYWVLNEALKRITWLKVIQYDDFELTEPVAIESVLSEVELAVTRLARAHGGVIARYTLMQQLLQPESATFSAMALHMALDGSPVLYRIDAGIFALRGAAFDPQALDKASRAVSGGDAYKRTQQPLSNREGYLLIQFELKPYVVNSRYFEVPSRLTQLMPVGDYRIEGFEETANYQILPSGSCRLRRVASKLVQMGFVVGDLIQMEVNPQTRVIIFSRAAATGEAPQENEGPQETLLRKW